MSGPALERVIAACAGHLTTAHADGLASVLETAAPDARAGAAQAVSPAAGYRRSSAALLGALPEGCDRGCARAAALALRAAHRAVLVDRAGERVDVVWTGPDVHGIPVRLTAQVLVDLLAETTSRAIVLSFAAKPVPTVVAALGAAGASGHVDLVVETAGDGAVLDRDDVAAFARIAGVRVWRWPREQRPVLASGRPASLHAKAVVVDGRAAFVTSANLTAPALEKNLELGVIVRGGSVPRRIAEQVDGLMANGVLVRADDG